MKRLLVALFALFPLPLLAGPGMGYYFVLPVTSASGQFDTYFRTDVSLVNPYPWKPITVELFFLRAGMDNTDVTPQNILLPPGGSVLLPDVLQNTFGTTGSGALVAQTYDISNSAFFLASARTYTTGPGGSYGLSSEGISEFNRGGQDALLSGIRNGNGFRTNTAVVSVNRAPLLFQVSAYDSNGILMGTKSVSVPPYGQVQVGVSSFAGAFDSGYLVWSCLTESGPIDWTAYATPIDNASGGSSFILDRRDDVYRLHRNAFNLNGTWTGPVVLGKEPARNVIANVSQIGPLLNVTFYDAATGEQIVTFKGYEDQGAVRLTGGGTNYACLGGVANAEFVATSTQLSGSVSGTGCFSAGGAATLTKQASSSTSDTSSATGPAPRGRGATWRH